MDTNSNSTYTFIMHFREGIYISQVNGLSADDAYNNYLHDLDVSEIKHLGKKSKQQLIHNFKIGDDWLTPIDTVANVWLTTSRISTGNPWIHIIKTIV